MARSAAGSPVGGRRCSPGATTCWRVRFAAARRRTLLFDVHQDTVPTDGMTIDPFLPRVENGRMWGRGSCDIKGGMAAMLVAMARLCARAAAAGGLGRAGLHGGRGIHAHRGIALGQEQTARGADLAVVAEPTLLDMVHCHKGAMRWKIRTRGVACHSSTPERGVNAIYRMARVLDALEKYAGDTGRRHPPDLGPPSAVGGPDRGGARASTSFPTGAKSRSIDG